MSQVDFRIENKVAYITINRPEKRNALNYDLVMELKKSFTKADTESNAKIIVFSGAGEHFCAGADLEYLTKLQKFSYEDNLSDSIHLMQLFKLIYQMKKPIVTKVQGAAIAGGCGLVAVSDFVIAADNSTFGFTEVKIGFVPAIVSFFLTKKIGEGRAKQLLLSGNIIDAKKAYDFGLLTEVVAKESLDEKTDEFVRNLLENNSSHAMSVTKTLLSKISNLSFDDSLKLAAETNAKVRNSEDCKKGLASFLEKKKQLWN